MLRRAWAHLHVERLRREGRTLLVRRENQRYTTGSLTSACVRASVLPEVCRLECVNGHCRNQRCICDRGWTGALCDQLQCDHRCHAHGFCANGSCICSKGWNGKHCTIGRPLSGSYDTIVTRDPDMWQEALIIMIIIVLLPRNRVIEQQEQGRYLF